VIRLCLHTLLPHRKAAFTGRVRRRPLSNYSRGYEANTSMTLRTVEHTDDKQLAVLVIDFVHDDIRESGHRPLKGAGDVAGVANAWKLRKAVGVCENPSDDTRCGGGTTILKIEMN